MIRSRNDPSASLFRECSPTNDWFQCSRCAGDIKAQSHPWGLRAGRGQAHGKGQGTPRQAGRCGLLVDAHLLGHPHQRNARGLALLGDAPGSGAVVGVASLRETLHPVSFGLFVDVVMAALIRGGGRHDDGVAESGEIVQKGVREGLGDVLGDLQAEGEVETAPLVLERHGDILDVDWNREGVLGGRGGAVEGEDLDATLPERVGVDSAAAPDVGDALGGELFEQNTGDDLGGADVGLVGFPPFREEGRVVDDAKVRHHDFLNVSRKYFIR
jgi:hypothetical protein